MEVVVIGNGVAGEAACSSVRSRTKEVKITLISQEPFPLYSPCVLTHYISKEVKRSKVFLKSLKDYGKEDIMVLLGQRVLRIDPSQKLVSLPGREVTYDKLVLATGSRPIIPPLEGVQKKRVGTLKSLTDADRIFRARGEKAIIVGSGPIGVELTVALRKRGWEVCLVEDLDWILPNIFDEKGSSLVRKILESHGVEILTGERVLAIEGRSHAKGVITSKTGRHKGDMVVLATGMQPSSELAREAGIEIGELGGVLTNDALETNIKDIYACGDCREAVDPFLLRPKLSLFWPQAKRQGTVAGLNSIGERCHVPWMPDVINLDIFGTFAGAMGQPARATDCGKTEVIEGEGKKNYHCLIISEGRMVGAQFIGDYEEIGVLLPLIGRDYAKICKQSMDEAKMVSFPWYHSARNLFL